MAMSQPAVERRSQEAGTQTADTGEDFIYEADSELYSRCVARIEDLENLVFNLGERLDQMNGLLSDVVNRHHPEYAQDFQESSSKPSPAQADSYIPAPGAEVKP